MNPLKVQVQNLLEAAPGWASLLDLCTKVEMALIKVKMMTSLMSPSPPFVLS